MLHDGTMSNDKNKIEHDILTADKEQLFFEQVKLLYKNAPIALIGIVVSVIVITFWLIFFVSIDLVIIILWSTSIILVTAARFILVKKYNKSSKKPEDAPKWCRTYVITIFVSGLLWGSASIFLLPGETVIHQVFIVFFIGGLATGSVGTYSSIAWASPAFVIPAFSPVAIRLLLQGDDMSVIMGGMLLFYGGTLLFSTRALHATTLYSLKMKIRNTGLIDYLKDAKEKTDILNEELNEEIIERKQALGSLKESEQNLELIMDTMNEGLMRVDNDDIILYVNDRMCAMTGYSREELVYQSAQKMLLAADKRTKMRNKLESRLNGSSGRYEIQIRKKSGDLSWFLISGSPVFDNDGNVVGSIGIHTDITSQKLLELDLRRFREAMDQSGEAIFITDAKTGSFIDVNETACTSLGYDRVELLKMKAKDIEKNFPFKTKTQWRKHVDEIRRATTPLYFSDGMHVRKDGTTIPVEVYVSFKTFEGYDYLVVIVRDISQRKQIDEKLNQRLAAIEASKDGIAIHDENEKYVYINDAYAKIYGYDNSDEMMGRSWKDNYEPVVWERLKSEFVPKLKDDGYWSGESVARKHDGSSFQQTISLSKTKGGGLISIIRDVSDRYDSEKTAETLYNISNAATSDISLNELIKYIHLYLGTIIDTTNFYIALYDKKTDMISFPYYVDEYSRDFKPLKCTGSIYSVAQVIRSKNPVYRSGKDCEKYIKNVVKSTAEYNAKVWLGVPLIRSNEVIGAMVVQNYSDQDRFSENDISLLEFVSGQIAASIETKRISEALKKSDEELKYLSNQIGQLSLSVADLITLENLQEVFDGISKAIVDYSDFRRVLISFYDEDSLNREILGFSGLDKKTVAKLRKMDMTKSQYMKIFESGTKVGQFSYYIPHTRKDIFPKNAAVFGSGPVPTGDDMWHPEDNLFVRMNDKEGNLIGVISVDESKSQQKPTAETVKPLEIFSSLISQIIIQRKSEQKLKQLEEELFQSQKMDSIGRMAGGIAHDFNNILAIVMGYADMLKQQFTDVTKDEGKAASIIFKNIKRASDLTQQLLNLARGGKHNPVLLDINKEIKNIVKISEKIFEKKIDVIYNFKDNTLGVEADKNQIGQVFTNLIINSKDAMPDGGTITFETGKTTVDKKNANNTPGLKPGKYAIIKISDTGSGMEKETLDQIFEPFFTKKPKGTGLGLPTVYRIIKNHKGHIAVESEYGKGTTFSLYLPASQKKIEKEKAEKRAIKLIRGSETVLIVDDEVDVNNLILEMLENMGYKVLQAKNGIDAVKLYKKKHKDIDLILLDMIMPKMSGHEAFFKLRDINPDARILIVSGFSQDDKTSELLTNGAMGFLSKPFELGQLYEAVAKALHQSIKVN